MLDNKLLEVINKLQKIFFQIPDAQSLVKLPQIVMIGAQSTGKSSTLESIVRHSFLPRGTDIVTRCPLVLQLINCPLDDKQYRRKEEGTVDNEEWGEFSHTKDLFFDFDDICGEIERQTEVIAGGNKGISSTSITLRIFSPHVVNLTLVDLPGLTKVSVGDQPEDIEYQIKDLVMEYANNPNSIILAISPATEDLANSESLKIAKQVDPEGKRTLAVITKVDRMQDPEEGTLILSGKSNINIPVKLGFIGIINRGQNDGKTLKEQLSVEKQIFEKCYPSIANRHGVLYLEKCLSKLLMTHIQECLPQLIARIRSKRQEYESTLNECGEEILDKAQTLTRVVINFMKNFCNIIDSNSINLKDLPENPIGGPAIRKVFDTKFARDLKNIEPELSTDVIIETLQKTGGPRPSLFASGTLFELFAKAQIEELKEPALKCAENIKKEIEKIIEHLVKSQTELKRFPPLMHALKSLMMKSLNERMPLTLQYIEDIFNTELSCINTNHPDFKITEIIKQDSTTEVAAVTAVAKPPVPPIYNFGTNSITTVNGGEQMEVDGESKEEKDAKMIKKLTEEYFKLEKKKIEDSVPKSIMFSLVNHMKEKAEVELLTKLLKNGESLLAEPEGIRLQRAHAQQMVKAMREAENVIDDVYEVSI